MALAVQHVEAQTYRGYELPPYEVQSREDDIEIRRYEPHLVAQVAVEGERQGAISRGFRVLARYIFGGNAENQKVAMTAPVTQAPIDPPGGTDGTAQIWQVTFMMPAEWSRETLPAPDNPAVQLVTTPAERQLVKRFSGRWSDRSLAAHEDALRRLAAERGLTITGPARYYFYDDPFTLPFRRRNEVAFPIAG